MTVSNTINNILRPENGEENPLVALRNKADAIESSTKIRVLRCHLGNPTAPQNEGTNAVLARYFRMRSGFAESMGYTDVAGQPAILSVIATAMNKINRLLETHLIKKENLVAANGGTGAL